MPALEKKNLFEGLRVRPVPTRKEAHTKLKTLLGEHSEHMSEKTLGHFLDTLNLLKKTDSEAA